MKCPKCGVENRKSSIQCIRCGSFFDEDSNKIKKERDHLKEIGKTIDKAEALELYIGDDANKVLSTHNKTSFILRFLWFYLKGDYKSGFIFQMIELTIILFFFYMGYSYIWIFLLFGLVYYFGTNPVYLKWAKKNVDKLHEEYEKSEIRNDDYKKILKSPKNRKQSFLCFSLGMIIFVSSLFLVGHYYYDTEYAKVNVSGWGMKKGIYVYNGEDFICHMTGYHSSNEKEYKEFMKKYNLLLDNGNVKGSFNVKFAKKNGKAYDTLVKGKEYRVVTYSKRNSNYDVEFFVFSEKGSNIYNCYDEIKRVIKNIEIKK